MDYATLASALDDIATGSFYEAATVTRIGDTYTVEAGCTGHDEMIMWTYKDGMELYGKPLDNSRLHEAYESYDQAEHIEYNLPVAVEAIREGISVTFQYVIVEAYCEDADRENCQEDHVAGWALVAYSEA